MLTILNKNALKTSDAFYSMARWFGIILIFGIPWSHAFFNIGIYGLFLCLALSPSHYKDWLLALNNKISLIAVLLFTYICIGLLYTSAGLDIAIPEVKMYAKLLIIPIFIVLYKDGMWTNRIIYSYALGAFILIIPTILDGTGILKALSVDLSKIKDGSYTNLSLVYWRNHIINGFHTSILFSICVLSSVKFKKYRIQLIFISLICLADVIFFINGRLALASIVSAILLLILQNLKTTKNKYLLVFILVFISIIFYSQSTSLQNRVKSVTQEAKLFHEEKNISTSGGVRLFYWSMSFDLFTKNPLFGSGPGSFRQNLISPDNPLRTVLHKHAHNEYLTLISQNGLIGLILFLYLTILVYKKNLASDNELVKKIVQIALLLFLLNSLTDSSLNNESEGWTFVVLASIVNFLSPNKYGINK